MITGINPTNNTFPWTELKSFVAKYDELFTPNSKVKFSLEIPKEGNDQTTVQRVKLTFAHPVDANGVKIYGETKSALQIVSECKLDLTDNTGKITLPQFNSTVSVNNEGYSINLPPNSHPDIQTFTKEAIAFFQDALERCTSDDNELIKETLEKLLSKKRAG